MMSNTAANQSGDRKKHELDLIKPEILPDSGIPSKTSNEVPDGGYGWIVVFGSLLTQFLVAGLSRSFGVYYLVLLDKFDQSSFATTLVIAIHNALRQILGPVSGLLVDRFSCRAVVIAGGLLMLAGCIISAYATSLVFLYWSFGVLAGFGGSLSFTPSHIIVGHYFREKRGRAMGLSTLGTGLGGIALAPLLSALLFYYGYWGTMLITAALMANIIVAGALFRPLSAKNRHSPSRTPGDAGQKFPVIARIKQSFSVLRNVTFFMYCLQVMAMTTCTQIFLQFLPGIAIDNNAESDKAVYLLSVAGIVDTISRLLWGFLFDLKAIRHRRQSLHAIICIAMGTVSICTGFMTSYAGLVVMTIAYNLFVGGAHGQRVTVVSEFVSEDQMSSTVGFVICFQGLSNILGPPLAGALRDATGSYSTSYYFSGSILVVTSTLFLVNYAIRSCLGKDNS